MKGDENAARAPAEMIGKKRSRAAGIRDMYYRQASVNDVSDELIKSLASVCLEYWSCLREFRDEPVVDHTDYPDVEPIRSRLGETVRVKSQSKRRSRSYVYETVPAVYQLDAEYLVEVTHALDDLAQKLGFGAAAAQDVEVFGVDSDPTGEDEA